MKTKKRTKKEEILKEIRRKIKDVEEFRNKWFELLTPIFKAFKEGNSTELELQFYNIKSWLLQHYTFARDMLAPGATDYIMTCLGITRSLSYILSFPLNRTIAEIIDQYHHNALMILENYLGILQERYKRIKQTAENDLEISTATAKKVTPTKVTSQGVFFEGQYFDALKLFTEILTKAKKSITILDCYINEEVLNLLTAKKQSVIVNILTKKVTPALKTAATVFNKQYQNLSIRTSKAFHDRFIIIDNKDFYHFGASFKDLGNRGFMFSRIEEPEVIKALRRKFIQIWKKAKVII